MSLEQGSAASTNIRAEVKRSKTTLIEEAETRTAGRDRSRGKNPGF